jgi:preprotein translocase subunit SecY
MFETIRNVFRIPDLRKRLLFTLMLLAIYRVGSFVPVPGVDPGALREFMADISGTASGGALDFVNMFTGGALARLAIFATGIMPYISASIILQLLTVVVPTLERLSKEGEMGRRKITQYTRYLTGVLAAIQATGMTFWLTSEQAVTAAGRPLVPEAGLGFYFMAVLTLTTGTVFLMWVGEQISERGIGNGISLLIFASIVVSFVPAIQQTYERVRDQVLSPLQLIFLVLMMVSVISFIIFIERAQRRIPVQYAKRVVGRKVRAGQSTHLPLKLNTSGVIPVIFAQAIIVLPGMLLALPKFQEIPWMVALNRQLGYAMPGYTLLYVSAIIFFCFFYTSIQFNPVDTTDNLKKFGGFIPGIRPGKKTAEYIDTVLTRITFWGALYLSLVSILPMWVLSGIRLHEIPYIGSKLFSGMPAWFQAGFDMPASAQSFFGGTSLLIVVGVAMDFTQQVESQLIMRNYDGFLRSGQRVRGRK